MKRTLGSTTIFLFAVLTFAPIVIIVVNAFLREGAFSLPGFISAIGGARIWIIIGRNVLLALTATAISTLFAVPAAWLSARTDASLGKLLPFIAITPLLIPSHTVAYSWMQLMIMLGETGSPLVQFYNAPFCIFVLSAYFFPIVYYGAYAAFKASDPLAEETALLYHSPIKVWFKVVLPNAATYLIAAIGLTMLLNFIEYGIPALLTVPTLVGELFVFMSGGADVNSALTLSTLSLLLIILAVWPIFKRLPIGVFFAKKDAYVRPRTYELGGMRFAAGLFLFFILSVTIFFPISALLLRAFNIPAIAAFQEAVNFVKLNAGISILTLVSMMVIPCIALPLLRRMLKGTTRKAGFIYTVSAVALVIGLVGVLVAQFSAAIESSALLTVGDTIERAGFAGLHFFREAIEYARNDIKVSVSVAFSAGAAAVLIGLPIARMLTRASGRYKYPLFMAVALMFLIPGTIYAIGMIQIYGHPALKYIYQSPTVIFLTHLGRFLPLAVLILAAGFSKIGERNEHIARLHGVSDIKAYLDVVLPSIRFEFWLAYLAVVVFSMAELGATTLVSPPGYTTITASLYIMMHYGNEERVSALCLIQIAIVLLPVMIFSLMNFGAKKDG